MKIFLSVVGMLHLLLLRLIRMWMLTYPVVLCGTLIYLLFITSKPRVKEEPKPEMCTIIDVHHHRCGPSRMMHMVKTVLTCPKCGEKFITLCHAGDLIECPVCKEKDYVELALPPSFY